MIFPVILCYLVLRVVYASQQCKDPWNDVAEDLMSTQWEEWTRAPEVEQNEWIPWFKQQEAEAESAAMEDITRWRRDLDWSEATTSNGLEEQQKKPHLTGPAEPVESASSDLEADIFRTLRGVKRPRLGRASSAFSTAASIGSRTSSTGSRRGRRCRDDEERPHVCDICGDTFRRLEHVKRHCRTVHTDEKPFICGVCNKGFSRSDNRDVHLASHNIQGT